MNRYIILLSFFLVCSAGFVPTVHSQNPEDSETILFSAIGFTNASGTLSRKRKRAIAAARYLVKKKISALFSTGKDTPLLSPDWHERIEIFDIVSNQKQQGGENLFSVRIIGSITLPITRKQHSGTNRLSTEILQTTITSRKERYREGEAIIFSLNGNKPFYACILDINERQEMIQLLPNAYHPDNKFAGNTIHLFPDQADGDEFSFEVSPPYGRETIYMVASSYPIKRILPLEPNDVFAVSDKTFQTTMYPVLDSIREDLLQIERKDSFHYVQVSTKQLLLQTERKNDG